MFLYIFFAISYLFNIQAKVVRPDLTVVGNMIFADGIDRLSISFIDSLYKDLDINFISTSKTTFQDVPQHVKHIANKPKSLYKNPNGNISLFLTNLVTAGSNPIKHLPASRINIAYSMLESTRIPKSWAKILNERFDLVAVPDKWLIDVYKKSGVTKPILELPHSIYLNKFLRQQKQFYKKEFNRPFVFGCSAVFSNNKNQELLIRGFHNAFQNNPMVKLVLHGRRGNATHLINLVKSLNANNIIIINRTLNDNQYVRLMASFDCYALISKGEGFSVTPREALALGLPCIISNNTAHKTICDTGFVRAVESKIKEPAYYQKFNQVIGKNFNCHVNDVTEALLDVYNNYETYLNKAAEGKKWVKQYLPENSRHKFISLFKPKKVIFSEQNKITKEALFTNNSKLMNKYLNLNKK